MNCEASDSDDAICSKGGIGSRGRASRRCFDQRHIEHNTHTHIHTTTTTLAHTYIYTYTYRTHDTHTCIHICIHTHALDPAEDCPVARFVEAGIVPVLRQAQPHTYTHT